ncbi:MAG: hypothetical protein ACE5H1_08745 [Thermodesulfobacteriota bacterium]
MGWVKIIFHDIIVHGDPAELYVTVEPKFIDASFDHEFGTEKRTELGGYKIKQVEYIMLDEFLYTRGNIPPAKVYDYVSDLEIINALIDYPGFLEDALREDWELEDECESA